jgi:hypothetical protein
MRGLAWAASLATVLVVASCGSSNDKGGAGSSSSGGASSGGSGDGGGPSFGDDGGSSGGAFGDGGHPTPTQPVTIDDCPGPVSAATATALEGGGPVDPAMKWLYPYDATVFPGGIAGPVLQWTPQSGGADGVYLHLKSNLFEYKGCFGSTNPMQLPVPDKAWVTAWQQSTGAGDPLHVELTTIAGGKVSGPITEAWTFALGSLKGLVYYNTYSSPQVANNGAVMVIQPGAAKPSPFLTTPGTLTTGGPCISCHSVSANGSMIVAQRHKYPGGLVQSESYDLLKTPTPNTNSPLAINTSDDWGFSAVYPDGSRLLTDGQANTADPTLFPAGQGDNPGMVGPKASAMYDPNTGNTIPTTGLPQHVMMPSFSPDGTMVVFNDVDTGGGHSLALMSFDASKNAFSNAKTIFKDTNAYPGWPFFTPDSKAVIFSVGNAPNFASTSNPPLNSVAQGNLYLVDVASGVAHGLDAANGLAPNGAVYLPYGARDQSLSFYPTVSPVAAGGYFWVFFTSRRNYGNILVDPNDNPPSKKIWVSAVSIGGTPGIDASHPAFYLPGQELGSGNIRAFAALAPCKQNGQSCTTGIDCCGGACVNGSCGAPSGCSSTDEKCTTTADCCGGTGLQCINGYCATVVQ